MGKGYSYRTLLVDALLFNAFSAPVFGNVLSRYHKGATVLLYHLVCGKGYHPFLQSGDLSSIDADLLKDQITWLLDSGYSFVTIDELCDTIINKEEMSSKIIAITFDDGFKVTIQNTVALFEALGVKATFFVTTDWIDSPTLLWQQKYYWYLAKYGGDSFFSKIKRIDAENFTGLSPTQCHDKFMHDVSPEQKENLLKQCNGAIPGEEELAASIYPSSEDIRALDASGMQVGSHSCGHYYMSTLADQPYLQQMLASKEKLERLLKKPVRAFSYPFNSYREDEALIKKAGYATVCTVDRKKVNGASSLTKLPRFDGPARRVLFQHSLRRILV